MFRPMALTVMFALVGALVLALTLMPALCSWLLTGDILEEDPLLIRWVKRLYAPILVFSLRFRWLVVACAVGLFALSAFVFSRLGAEFVPQLDEGSLTIQFIRTTSISLDASVAMQERSEKVLLEKFPEVTYTFSRIGTAEVATDPMGPNAADTYIMLKPPGEWRQVDGKPITKAALAE